MHVDIMNDILNQVAINRKNLVWFVIVFIVILTSAIRLRMLDIPLDRDEGQYAYIAQLLMEGIPPYAKAYNVKFPGIFYIM